MSLRSAVRVREGLIAVGVGAVLWGTNGVLVRYVSNHSSLASISIGCYRLIFSSAALILVAGVPSIRAWRAASAANRGLLVISGALLGIYQALYFAAIGNVGISVSTLVSLAVAPLAITTGQAAHHRAWPSARASTVLALAVLGLALISLSADGGSHAPHPVLGILESIGSGLGYAGSTVVSRRLHDVAGPLVLTTVSSIVGAIVLLPLAVVAGLGFHATVPTMSSLAYMGVVATALAYGLFFHGLRTTPPEVASVLTLLEPLAATLLAVALVGERLPLTGWAGAVLLLVAIGVLYAAPQADGEHPEAPATIAGAPPGT
jgi:DME family drug/metabolite transporter